MLVDTDAPQELVLLLLQESNEELISAGPRDINGGQLQLQLRLIFLHYEEVLSWRDWHGWDYVSTLRTGY